MAKASLYNEARNRLAEQEGRVAELAAGYEPPVWPFDMECVIKRFEQSSADEIRAAERVHFARAREAFERAREVERRRSVLWFVLGVAYFMIYLLTFRIWYDALEWEWGLQAGGEVTWRGTAVFLAGYAIFLTIGYWMAESPPAKRFVNTVAGGERWSLIGSDHADVALALRQALDETDELRLPQGGLL